MSTHPDDLQPLSHTSHAIATLERHDDPELMTRLRRQAHGVRLLVPDLIAFSVSTVDPGITFTLLVSRERMASLHALRPEPATGPGTPRQTSGRGDGDGDPLDEGRWQRDAQGSDASGIGSSLTTPIFRAGTAIGTVDLYAHSTDAFAGLHDELSDICGTWAPGAVSNADLSFTTIGSARRAPATLRDTHAVETAAGYIAARDHLSPHEARGHLLAASELAGVDPAALAALVLDAPRP